MGQPLAFILAAVIFVSIIAMMGSRNPAPPPQPLKPDLPYNVTKSIGSAIIPIALSVQNGQLNVVVDVKIPTAFMGTFGLHISPHHVGSLYIRLGNVTRAYQVDGYIKVYIPNSLNGRATFEWDDDSCVITVEDPAELRFPDGNR